jgi:ATP-dependent exoDNAse (exonuclease V) beta subunit
VTLADQGARDLIANDLDATLVVEAAAGTGKTTALVGRIVAVVRSGVATLDRIIAVTFTEKAAGEMKLRLRGALERARQEEPHGSAQRKNLEHALEQLEVARIGTIHALCADLLREHPVEARVDPLFEVCKEPEAQGLLDAAFDTWLPGVLHDPPEGVRRLLRRRLRRRDAVPPREQLRRAAWQLVGHRDFHATWRRDSGFRRDSELDALVPKIRELGAMARYGASDDYLRHNLNELQRFADDLDHREGVAHRRDHDGLEASLSALARHRSWNYKHYGAMFGPLQRAEVIAKRDALKAELDAVLVRAEADLAACLHHDLWPLVEAYEREKERSGKLDFFDLLLKLRELLTHEAAVRRELQDRFTHLFVDEFQDTDPLQADILRLLAADDPGVTDPEPARPKPGKLFLVGDPKQSIYRFRRADVALYEAVKKKLLDDGAQLVDLTTSFRGEPSLQEAINTAFEPHMVQEGEGPHTQARYVKLTRWRKTIPDQPSLVALPVPRPYAEYGRVTNGAVDASLPDAVGAFIAWLVNSSGWKVIEPGTAQTLVPVQPRHVCVLFRRFRRWEGDDVTLAYTRALEARGIPHVLVGGRSFHSREEVLALRNALAAIEWPDDELSVYATLRGPLFALSDDALLVFRHATKGRLHPFKPVDLASLPPAAQPVAEALALLARLHRDRATRSSRNSRPISDTLAQLLEATRAHAGIAFWTAGEQALANLAQLADLARRYEATRGRSFRGFVNLLARQAERGEVPEAPIVEEASEGVRMMTVHGAKGLEFPVVILADPTCPMTHRDPSQWVDAEQNLWAEPLAGCAPLELVAKRGEALKRDHEEAVRLTYVAVTRARDLLVVPAVGDQPLPGWVDVLHPVLYPRGDERRDAKPAPGCPTFGAESVLDRPDKARFEVSVMPGRHRSDLGGHEVVWWDPALLPPLATVASGIKGDEVLREGPAAAASLAEYAAWRESRAQFLARGAAPSLEVVRAAEALVAAVADPTHGSRAAAVPTEATSAAREARPRGRRFGALVHGALAGIPLAATPADVARTVAAQAKALGSPEDERRSAVEAVKAVLEHPLWKRAAASAKVHREVPLTVTLDDGRFAEGVADLAFREGAGWTVVDFKTDFELEANRARYEAQLQVYARAISAATGLPAQTWLLSV